MINTKFFCRLCALLHEPRAINPGHHYDDFNEWWRGKGTCINGNWNKFYAALEKDKKAASIRKSSDSPKPSSSAKIIDNKVQADKKAGFAEVLKEKETPKAKEEDKVLDFEDLKP